MPALVMTHAVGDHQIARVIVAMNEHSRLLQDCGDQRVERTGDPASSASLNCRPRCLPQNHSGNSSHLTTQQRVVIGRQLRGRVDQHAPG